MKKRLLSLALCLALCLGLLPVGVLALEEAVPSEDSNTDYVASVTTSDGESTNYTSLDDALDAAKDGDTVKLLENHTTNWSNVEAGEEQMAVVKTRITLDLNGNTVDYLVVGEVVPDEEGGILDSYDGNLTVQSSQSGGTAMDGQITTLKFVRGTLAVQDGVIIGSSLSSPSGLICEANSGTVTISGGMVYNATVGTGAAVTVSGGSMHQGEWVNNGTLNITGGTFGSVKFNNNSGTIAISGGTFSTLQNFDNTSDWPIAPMSLLAPGHAFYKDNTVQDGSVRYFLQDVTVKEHTHTMVNNKCACGYTCPHTSVDANGACTVCHKQFAASITEGKNVTYYDTFNSALVYATQNNGCTLKLLADVTGTTVMINNPFIFDLNGHSVDALSVDAKATIKDSGTTKGSIGKVTVFDTKVPGLTLGSLLEEGYGFKYGNGYWANDSYLQTTQGSFVTVEKAPIQSVNVYAKDKNNQEILTIAYGATGEVTLEASCWINDMTVPTYTWYKLEGAAATAPMDGVNGVKYKLPDDLPAGKHTYLVTCTSDGYSKSAEITITVEKANLSKAEITFPNGNEAAFKYWTATDVPMFVVTYKGQTLEKDKDFTITGGGSTYDVGPCTLTIKATDSGDYTGSKSAEWTVRPLTVAASVGDIIKTYDGTTNLPANATITLKSADTYYTGVALPLAKGTDYEVLNAHYDSADASTEEKTISFTIKLKNAGYVFEDGTKQKDFTLNGAELDDKSFKINKAAAPTNIPTGTLNVINGTQQTYTYDFSKLLPKLSEGEYGTISYGNQADISLVSQSGYYYDASIVEFKNGVLTLAQFYAKDGNMTDRIGNVKVKVTTTNYEDFQLTLVLNAVNKIKPTPNGTITASKITYGDTLSKSEISGKMKDPNTGAEVEGTFSWVSPEDKPSTTEKYVAKWVFTPKDKNTYATVHGETNITVNKATPTGKPEYTAITTSGKKLSDANLTQAETSFSVPGTVAWKLPADTEVTANTAYEWVFTPNDTDNYNTLTGTITLWHKSSSGSSSGSVTPGTKTDTVKNPDGSTTKTETKADGSKTETTTASSAGGSTGSTVTKTDSQGNRTTEAEAKLSEKDVKNAQESGEAVQVPVKKIEAAKDSNRAPEIKVELPSGAGKTTVEIPVDNVSSGTVAVIVHPDGTEELVKDSKPTEHGVQLELSGSTTVKIIDNSKTFDDTKGHWSQDDVNFVAARELFNGVGGNQFGVSQPMTRGMVNTVLARLADVDTTPGQGQAWYEVGTDWAKKNGISDGTNPTAPVTREQLATLLYRYAGSPSVSGTLHAADAASVSDYAEDALLWANQNGIVNGVGSNTIAPKDNAQRAQVAAMLARYLQNQ